MAKKGNNSTPSKADQKPKKVKEENSHTKGFFDKLRAQKSKLETFSKLAQLSVFFLAITYLSGFIIINSYYSSLGFFPRITGFTSISAGVFPITGLAVILFSLRISRRFWENTGRFSELRSSIYGLGIINIGALIILSLVYPLINLKPLFPFPGWLSGILAVGFLLVIQGIATLNPRKEKKEFLPALIATLLLFFGTWFVLIVILSKNAVAYFLYSVGFYELCSFVFPKSIRTQGTVLKWIAKTALSPIIIPLILVVALLVYGKFLYPKLPRFLGGGQPHEIILYSNIQIPLSLKPQQEPLEVELLDKTGDEYIIRIKDSLDTPHIIELGKNKVEAIVYLTPKQIKARQATADSLEAIQKEDSIITDTFPAPDSS